MEQNNKRKRDEFESPEKKERTEEINWKSGRKVKTNNSTSNGYRYDVLTGAFGEHSSPADVAKAHRANEESWLSTSDISVVTQTHLPPKPSERGGPPRKPMMVPTSGRAEQLAASLKSNEEFMWSQPNTPANKGREISLFCPFDEVKHHEEVLGDELSKRNIGLASWQAESQAKSESNESKTLPVTGFGMTRRAAQMHALNGKDATAMVMIDDQVAPNPEVEDGYDTDDGEKFMIDRFKETSQRSVDRSELYYSAGQGSDTRHKTPPTNRVKMSARPAEQVVVVGESAPYNPRAFGGGEDIEQTVRMNQRLVGKVPNRPISKKLTSQLQWPGKAPEDGMRPQIAKRDTTQIMPTPATASTPRKSTVREKGPQQRFDSVSAEPVKYQGKASTFGDVGVDLAMKANKADQKSEVSSAVMLDRARANMASATLTRTSADVDKLGNEKHTRR